MTRETSIPALRAVTETEPQMCFPNSAQLRCLIRTAELPNVLQQLRCLREAGLSPERAFRAERLVPCLRSRQAPAGMAL